MDHYKFMQDGAQIKIAQDAEMSVEICSCLNSAVCGCLCVQSYVDDRSLHDWSMPKRKPLAR